MAKIIGDEDQGEHARRVEFLEIPIATNSKNEVDFAGDVQAIVGKLSNATLYIDNGGIGHTVCTLIERAGGQVERIDWGKPCFKNEYKKRYYNLRACAMVRLRDAIRQGRVVLPQGLSKQLKEKLLTEGSRLPYHFTEAGGLRYVMQSKQEMLRNGIKSPDIIDALSFAFLEGCTYVPTERDHSKDEEKRQDRREAMKERLAKARAQAAEAESEAA